jgi:hypothetical protein
MRRLFATSSCRASAQVAINVGTRRAPRAFASGRLNEVSDPGTPYPKWTVLQLDTAEDPRPKALHPEDYASGAAWKDLRGQQWAG